MPPHEVIQIWNESKDKEEFKTKLIEQGFQTIGFGRDALVFSKKCLDYVVKVTNNSGVPTRKFKEESLERFRLGYIFVTGNRQVAIQSKVNRSKKSNYRAWTRIRNAVDLKIDLYHYDIHQDNVGFLNRKPVIFDYK